MGDNTKISWSDASWNPTRGCSRTIAAGSTQSGCGDGSGGGCYAEAMAGRIVRMGRGKPTAYDGLVRPTPSGYRWTGKVVLDPDKLALPLRWRRPRRIFVDSMSDLFHEALTNEQIAAVFGVMAACPQHTFQILTKRARRMRAWFQWRARSLDLAGGGDGQVESVDRCLVAAVKEGGDKIRSLLLRANIPKRWQWPLPNVWNGVSCENQAAADERIPDLLETPAAVRFLSCEPLLGLVDAKLTGCFHEGAGTPERPDELEDHSECAPRISWLIAGCESGLGARSAEVGWFRSLRDQCAEAGVPFFLKQAVPFPMGTSHMLGFPVQIADPFLSAGDGSRRKPRGMVEMPYLDGVQHVAMPAWGGSPSGGSRDDSADDLADDSADDAGEDVYEGPDA